MLAVVGVAIAMGVAGSDGEGTACDGRQTLVVSAVPAIAPVVEELAASADGVAAVGACVDVEVRPEEPVVLAGGTLGDPPPALWVADSSLWAQELAAGSAEGSVEVLGPMAASPLVVAATRPAAERVTGQAAAGPVEVPWRQLLAGRQPFAMPDPAATTEGLATLAVLDELLGADPGQPPPQDLVRALVAVSRGIVPTVQAAYDLAADPAATPLFPASEQSVLAHNREAGATPVLALYPAEGTVALDFPVVRVSRPDEPIGTDGAARALDEVLRSPAAAAAVQAAGFRAPDGTASADLSTDDGVREDTPAALPAPTSAQSDDVLRTWSAVTLQARMLTVIDVSGSMREDAGNGRTRVELARDASNNALVLYPDSAQIGLWAFSVLQNPPADWVSLVDLGALSDDVGGTSRRQALLAAAATLPGRARDGTALYDTTLAAFRAVRSGYDPGRVNSVVLLTDGRNEDDAGIDLPTLLQTLRAENDPAQPVPIITVGMGPDADLDTLRQISELTGGKAYEALDPADIETVFLDAMVERRCRPSC